MELRPFRCLRYSPRVVFERGLPALIAPPEFRAGGPEKGSPAPENIRQLTRPSDGSGATGAAATLEKWRASGLLLEERRPGLWLYRRTTPRPPNSVVASLLVGLVRLAPAGPAPLNESTRQRDSDLPDRLALRRALRADFEPCLLATRAPLAGALATTRRAELTAEDAAGVRHDAFRISDFAQHVELQGLVKTEEISIVEGPVLWEAAREFEKDPEAARLPGARFKLCAIVEESFLREHRDMPPPAPALGLFGVALEDPVY